MSFRKAFKWEAIFRTHEGDAVPFSLVAISVFLSIISLIAGLFLAAADFLVNVTAGLTVLGPGLVITNLAIRSWRHSKNRDQIKPSFATVTYGFHLLLKAVVYYLKNTSQNIDMPSSLTPLGTRDTSTLIASLKESGSLLEQRLLLVEAEKHGTAPMIPVSYRLLDMPDLQIMPLLVAGINAIHPVPAALTQATLLSHRYASTPFVVVGVVLPPPEMSHHEPLRIRTALQGFHHLRNKSIESRVPYDSSEQSLLRVNEVQYVSFLTEAVRLAVRVLESMLQELPPIQNPYWAALDVPIDQSATPAPPTSQASGETQRTI